MVSVTTLLLPAVTLTWSDPFPAASPFQYQLTYTGEKLSGESQAILETLTLSQDELTTGAMMGQYLYSVTDLLFYTDYNFTVIADYNLTGTVAQSSAVVVSHQTRQGGEGPGHLQWNP